MKINVSDCLERGCFFLLLHPASEEERKLKRIREKDDLKGCEIGNVSFGFCSASVDVALKAWENKKKKSFKKKLDNNKKISTFAIPNRTGVTKRSLITE